MADGSCVRREGYMQMQRARNSPGAVVTFVTLTEKYTPMTINHLERVRRMCLALPDATEKLSHGEPTFFVRKKVFVMFADNHHADGRVAVWLPVPPGTQRALIETSPATFFKPPYVGVRGWVGIELSQINDDDLKFHIHTAWGLIAPKKLQSAFVPGRQVNP
jgi:hypothetical protein